MRVSGERDRRDLRYELEVVVMVVLASHTEPASG
jgi:hypothetical protein